MSLRNDIDKIPIGFSLGFYRNKKYSITKEVFNQGSSFKIFGRELAGTDFISLNYYRTKKSEILKPCEMPEKKVIDFLHKLKII